MKGRIPTRDLGPVGGCSNGSRGRRIYDIDGQLVLVEIEDGSIDVIGPCCSRADAVTLARAVLINASNRHPLPMMLHKLALAVLAAAPAPAPAPTLAASLSQAREVPA